MNNIIDGKEKTNVLSNKISKKVKKKFFTIEKSLSSILIIVLLWLSFSLSRSLLNTMARQKRLEEERENVAVLSAQVEQLQQEKDYYYSDSFVEKEARDKLGFVMQNEKIIILPEGVIREINNMEQEVILKEYEVRQNWQNWLSFFLFQDR